MADSGRPEAGEGRPGGTDDDWNQLALESMVSDLDSAHEELRVAEEELQTQQEEIDRLLRQNRTDELWQERLIANLPVAVLVTDREGKVKSANGAACAVLGLTQMNLLRKPLQTFVAAEDRQEFRQALSQTQREDRGRSLVCAIQPRAMPAVRLELIVARGPDADERDPRVIWIMLPAPADASGGHGDARIAEALSQLAVLSARTDHSHYLTEVARICGQVIAPAAALSVTVGPPADPTVLASDSKLAQDMDALQIQTGEGPCQEAWESRRLVLTNRLDDDERWPYLARLAAPERVESVLAVPVFVGDETVGVVNAYATEPDVFAELDVHTAELLASAVAAVIHQVNEHDRLTNLTQQLEEALTSRAVIDQAKGIIVARYGCEPAQAFQRLVRVSRNQNIKLREVARMLVEQAQHPPRNPPDSQ
ncbi:MAG: ANTAR domain-containing protein [Nocardioidaceae bacterium]